MSMNDKFYVKSLIRNDGKRLDFDAHEIYLSTENTFLMRPDINSTEVEYTDIDGGEMIWQRLPAHTQQFAGLICPRESNYWSLYSRLVGFFKINHYYKIIYKKKDGGFFSQNNAWLSENLQIPITPYERYSSFSLGLKVKSSVMYEYSEDNSGEEMYANSIVLSLISASIGGDLWDSKGHVWDDKGNVWESGSGGIQSINVDSLSIIYPVWTVEGPAINPSLQNNTTDTLAVYNGSVAAGQTLVVDFETGIAELNGAKVSLNLVGQVSFNSGLNLVGFSTEGGTTSTSKIEWNNIIG